MPELDVDGAVFCFPDDWEASKFDEWAYFRSVMSRIVATRLGRGEDERLRTDPLYLRRPDIHGQPAARL